MILSAIEINGLHLELARETGLQIVGSDEVFELQRDFGGEFFPIFWMLLIDHIQDLNFMAFIFGMQVGHSQHIFVATIIVMLADSAKIERQKSIVDDSAN